jgi:dolichyl-phosphate beta-glucosyltransferase
MSCALSVVLPIFDEEDCLERTLAELVRHLEGLEGLPSFEIVCVDDGSRDCSPEILARAAAADARIRFERLPANRGKGAAVRTGMLAARGERCLFMDADLSTPLTEIAGFLSALDAGYDVVIGNRRAPGSRITQRQPWLRETLGRGFTALTRLVLVPGIADFTCGFKAFRAQAAREIFARSTLDGWAFDAELVVIAHGLGLRLAQLPVEWHHDQGTKVRLVRAVAGSFLELAAVSWKRLCGRYR